MGKGKFENRSNVTVEELLRQRDPSRQRAEKKPSPRGRGPRLGGLIFYTVLSAFVLLFYMGLLLGLGNLRSWLVRYEAAQPTQTSQQVFEALFAEPDWAALYDLAGIADTPYEGKDAFVWYLSQQEGELTFLETSAGLSGDRKYRVSLGEAPIAVFTLADRNRENPAALPDWQLETLEFTFQRRGSWTVTARQGCHVTVNGVSLTDREIVRLSKPLAQDYLPPDMIAPTACTWEIPALLAPPQVTVTGPGGDTWQVRCEEDARRFTAAAPEDSPLTEAECQLALDALKTQCEYSLSKRITDGDLARYFSRSSSVFQATVAMERRWLQEPRSYSFSEETVTDLCRYSDSLYSLRAGVTVTQTRDDGSTKENRISQSLFFTRQPSGKWLCTGMTAVDVSQTEDQVRLAFFLEDALLQSTLVDAASRQVSCPAVSAPEGLVFSGWMAKEESAAGKEVLRLVLLPDGTVRDSGPLEPMVLCPLFESE